LEETDLININRVGLKAESLTSNYSWLFVFLVFAFLPFSSFYNIPLAILSITGLCILIFQFKEIINETRIKIFLALFLCIYMPMLIAHPDAIQPDESLRKIFSFVVYVLFGISIILYCFKHEKTKYYFIYAVGILLLLWSFDALWQYYYGKNLLGYPLQGYPYLKGRVRGIFYPHYRIGLVLAILSPFYFEFIRIFQDKFILSWTLLFPFIVAIILGGNRTSWVMLLLSAAIYTVYFLRCNYHKNIHLRAILYGTIFIVVMIFSIYIIRPAMVKNFYSLIETRISTIKYNPNDPKPSNSFQHRVQIWETGLRIVKDNWVNGIGVRGFRYIDQNLYIHDKDPVISKHASISTHSHQITLEILIETGVIGIIGFILFWVLLVRYYVMGWHNYKYRENLFWLIPVMVATFPLNMHKSFYGHFSSIIIWILVSIAVANIIIDRRTEAYT